jgi:hypothetical protein
MSLFGSVVGLFFTPRFFRCSRVRGTRTNMSLHHLSIIWKGGISMTLRAATVLTSPVRSVCLVVGSLIRSQPIIAFGMCRELTHASCEVQPRICTPAKVACRSFSEGSQDANDAITDIEHWHCENCGGLPRHMHPRPQAAKRARVSFGPELAVATETLITQRGSATGLQSGGWGGHWPTLLP